MLEESSTICKFHQTGFCKFGSHCKRKHEDQICDNQSECTSQECQKRHPKICRNFIRNEQCIFKEKCAYSHKTKIDSQHNLNEKVTLLLLKHENDIKALTEEVNNLKLIFHIMSTELGKSCPQKNSIPESVDEYKNSKSATNEDASTLKFKCQQCDYVCEKKITLHKHTNTKHGDMAKKQ